MGNFMNHASEPFIMLKWLIAKLCCLYEISANSRYLQNLGIIIESASFCRFCPSVPRFVCFSWKLISCRRILGVEMPRRVFPAITISAIQRRYDSGSQIVINWKFAGPAVTRGASARVFVCVYANFRRLVFSAELIIFAKIRQRRSANVRFSSANFR